MGDSQLAALILDLRAEEIFCENALRFYQKRLKEVKRLQNEYQKKQG